MLPTRKDLVPDGPVDRDLTPVAHTFAHVDCPACERARHQLMIDPETLGRLTFAEASKYWLDSRKAYLKKRTYYGYELHVEALNHFFGPMVVAKIHIGHIREYQRMRTHNEGYLWASSAGPSIVNHELVVLQGVLKRAGEWQKIAPHFEALPLPSSRPPKVMSDAEEIRLFHVAASSASWQIAYWVASLTCNTGASGTELRNLKFEDVHLDHRTPWFRIDDATAKNEFRGRVVVMNRTAQAQMERCMERARKLGSGRPGHYIFPFREAPGRWDPARPTTDAWLRRSFKALREAAGLPWLTPHCLRHQHITLSYEAGEPEQQISQRVGHSHARMTRWYLGTRRDTQQAAVDKLDPLNRFASTPKLL